MSVYISEYGSDRSHIARFENRIRTLKTGSDFLTLHCSNELFSRRFFKKTNFSLYIYLPTVHPNNPYLATDYTVSFLSHNLATEYSKSLKYTKSTKSVVRRVVPPCLSKWKKPYVNYTVFLREKNTCIS